MTSARIAGIATAYPPYELRQADAPILLAQVYPRLAERMAGVAASTQIDTRQLAAPPAWYVDQATSGNKGALYAQAARALAREAAQAALERAGGAAGVDAIVTVSTTGTVVPSLAATLVNDLGLSREAVQLPIWGYGCAGGALGLSRALDLVKAGYRRVLLVAVEICSSSILHSDQTPNGYVASCLFGDAAAALVLETASDEGGHQVQAFYNTLWADSEDVMRFDAVEGGYRVRFGQDLPALLRERLADVVAEACASWGWQWADVQHLVAHTGGPKILEAVEEALCPLPGAGLADAWAVLREHGNTSSVSVLAVLERTLQREVQGPTLLLGMGPGFNISCVQLTL